jgi:hypothetical protein
MNEIIARYFRLRKALGMSPVKAWAWAIRDYEEEHHAYHRA